MRSLHIVRPDPSVHETLDRRDFLIGVAEATIIVALVSAALIGVGAALPWLALGALAAQLSGRAQRRADAIFARAMAADLAEGGDAIEYAEAA